MTLGQGGDTHQNEQKAIAKGKNSLAITAAAYSNVTVYQYVTYDGGRATTRETTDPSVCPYPGLETFHTSEAEYFAGREEDVALLEAKLEDHDICGVIAASGAGKSSLVHAGLIPLLAKRENEAWDVFAFKPGQEPLYGLARSMSGVLAQEDNLDAQLNEIRRNVENLRETSGRLSEYVEEIVRRRSGTTSGKHHHVLIFIDQWEELYTRENEEERDVLVRELMEVAKRGLAKVLLTMRIDFMEEMLLLSTDFFRDLKPGIHFVEPMDETGLRSAIEVPAEEVGLGVPEALTSRLITDLGKGRDHGSLPYLQFVLRQLWEKRDQANNCLTTEAYDGMKGLQGAIGAHADAVFRKLTKGEQSLAQRVLPRLANVSVAGAITSRRLPFADFDEPARQLLRKLAEPERRLVVLSSATEDVIEAEIVAEVAHEALLDDWKTLSGWITDRKDFFRLRNKLEADAKTWIENDRRNDFLIPAGKPLLDAQDLSEKALEGDISNDLNDFIEASDRRARSRKWLTRGLLTAVVSGIAGIAIYLANVNQDLANTNIEVERRSALLAAENSYNLVELGETDRALLSLLEGAKAFKGAEFPEVMTVAFHNAIQRASREKIYQIPIDTDVFPDERGILYHNRDDLFVYHFNGSGPPVPLVQLEQLDPVLTFYREGFLAFTSNGDVKYYSLDDGSEIAEADQQTSELLEFFNQLKVNWDDVRVNPAEDSDASHLYSRFHIDTPNGSAALNLRNELVIDREVADPLKESEVFSSYYRAASLSDDCGTHVMPERVARSVASTPSYGELGCRRTFSGFLHSVINGGTGGTFNYEFAYKEAFGEWRCRQFWGRDIDFWDAEAGSRAVSVSNNILSYLEPDWGSFDIDVEQVNSEQSEFFCDETFREAGTEITFPAPIFSARRLLSSGEENSELVLVSLPSLGEIRVVDPRPFSPGKLEFNYLRSLSGDVVEELVAAPQVEGPAARPFCFGEYNGESKQTHKIGRVEVTFEAFQDDQTLMTGLSHIGLSLESSEQVFEVSENVLNYLNTQTWSESCIFVDEESPRVFFQSDEAFTEVVLRANGARETDLFDPSSDHVFGISPSTSQVTAVDETGIWLLSYSDRASLERERIFLNESPVLSVSVDDGFKNVVLNMNEGSSITAALISIGAKRPWRVFDGYCHKWCYLAHVDGASFQWDSPDPDGGYRFSVPSSDEAVHWAEKLLSPHCRDYSEYSFSSSSCY